MKRSEAISTIKDVAKRIASKKPDHAAELMRIAQFYEGAGPVREFQSDNSSDSFMGGGMPIPDQGTNLSSGHPDIEPFVNMKVEKPMVDERETHTLTLTLKAPEDVSEAEMMNYMLGMGEKLGVDVDGFKWTKSEPKASKTV